MLVDVVRLPEAGKRDAAHDLFDAHLPLIRYEQQPGAGLAVRKYVLKRRGILASDAQRKPGGALSAAAKAEVDYLLSRLGRVRPARREARRLSRTLSAASGDAGLPIGGPAARRWRWTVKRRDAGSVAKLKRCVPGFAL